jgi:hypothetical protein
VGSGDDEVEGDDASSAALLPSPGRKRRSCGSEGHIGDVFIDPQPVTVDALDAHIRKLSAASAQVIGLG